MNKGFISIPILIIAVLGTIVVGGGGYTVYKINQIENESSARVAELERRIERVNDSATSTKVGASYASSTLVDTKELEDEVEDKSLETDPDGEQSANSEDRTTNQVGQPKEKQAEPVNYNAIAITHWQSEVRLSQQLLPSAELMLSKMIEIKSELEKLKVMVSNEANDAIDAPTENLLDQTARSINEDLSNTEMYIDFLSEYAQEIKNNIAYSKQQLTLAQNSFYTRADFDNFKTTHQSQPTFSETAGNDVFGVWDEFLQYRNGRDADYRTTFELVIDRNKQLQASYNSYLSTLQQIPKVEIPKVQTTNCTIIENMVNCETRY